MTSIQMSYLIPVLHVVRLLNQKSPECESLINVIDMNPQHTSEIVSPHSALAASDDCSRYLIYKYLDIDKTVWECE